MFRENNLLHAIADNHVPLLFSLEVAILKVYPIFRQIQMSSVDTCLTYIPTQKYYPPYPIVWPDR